MITETSRFWSGLIELNRVADDLISRAQKAIEPYQPISREIPFFASIEVVYDNTGLTTNPESDALAGANLKRQSYLNAGSRVYVRELSLDCFKLPDSTTDFSRSPNMVQPYQPNYRWNFYTSLTDKRYANPRGCLAAAGGNPKAGNHLAFREPRIIEPRESFVFECELLSSQLALTDNEKMVVAMYISGYREGV